MTSAESHSDDTAQDRASRFVRPQFSGNLDDRLLSMEESDTGEQIEWRIRDAVEGTQIFGATGSGKTSGSGFALAQAMLKAGFGGLVLTAKPGDAEDWAEPNRGYLRLAGREPPIIIGPQSRWRRYAEWGCEVAPTFDFLDYEYRRAVGLGYSPSINLTDLFLTAMEGSTDRDSVSREPFWDDAVRQLVSNALELCSMSEGRVSLSTLIATCPNGSTVQGAVVFQCLARRPGIGLLALPEAGRFAPTCRSFSRYSRRTGL